MFVWGLERKDWGEVHGESATNTKEKNECECAVEMRN